MDYGLRRRRLRAAAAEAGVDLLAVAPGPNMLYLLGYHPHIDERPCYLFLTADGEGLLVPDLNAEEVRNRVDLPLVTYADEEGPAAALARLLAELGARQARRVMVEEPMRYDFVLHLKAALPEASFATSERLLGAMRMRKDAEELAMIRENAAMADRVMAEALAAIRVGMAEVELAALIGDAFRREGALRTNFAIVGSGPNSAFPHHASGPRRMEAGDAVVLDIGAHYGGYNSDITRMAFVGEPMPEYQAVHAVVEEAVQAAKATVRPGVPAKEVDDAARAVITAAGYGPYFTHRVGHGLGVTGHEPPYMTGTNELLLEEGMTFSIEPGIYLPGRFGVRLEELAVVTRDGVETLSRLPRTVHSVRL
jgi:Xaa-Pro aminopeptidase